MGENRRDKYESPLSKIGLIWNVDNVEQAVISGDSSPVVWFTGSTGDEDVSFAVSVNDLRGLYKKAELMLKTYDRVKERVWYEGVTQKDV